MTPKHCTRSWFRRAVPALVLGVALSHTPASADSLTLCQPVFEFSYVTHGFFVYDACPPTPTPPASDGQAATPLVDPTQCQTFVLPSNTYEEQPPFYFKIPVHMVDPAPPEEPKDPPPSTQGK